MLQKLFLTGTRITDKGIPKLKELEKLLAVDLGSTARHGCGHDSAQELRPAPGIERQ